MNDALFKDAMRAHEAGNAAEAARLCENILRGDARHFGALFMLGMLHLEAGRDEDAERHIGSAVAIHPGSPDAQYHRGLALLRLRRHVEALNAFDAALRLQPNLVPALVNRSVALLAMERFAETLEACDRVAAVDPANVDAWNNGGNAFLALGRNDEAVIAYDRALELEPGFAEGWVSRGLALNRLNRSVEAVASFDKALTLAPATPAVLFQRGLALARLKQFGEAVAAFEELLRLDPEFPFALGELAISRFHCCDWAHAAEDRARLSGLVRAGALLDPHIVVMLLSDPAEQLRCARRFAEAAFPPAAAPPRRAPRSNGKIKLAYLSADFHEHATAYLMAGLFERHDKTRFETIAISFGPDDQGPMRARLVRAFDEFIDVRAKSNSEVAALLREMEIDIAVDLKGYTSWQRAGILGYRAAPVQVNYLGFPGTMGAAHNDYIVADPVLIGEGDEQFYSEAVVRLPDTYQPTDFTRAIGRTPSRAEAGLPERGFVFASFNNPYKLTPEVFDVWMRILKAVPDSVLWQWTNYPAVPFNLRREAEARGVSGERIVFAARVSQPDHLARLRLADLFLDTLPYNAHTTASDALWAGLPLVTRSGATFASRVAASILRAAGLPELITHTLEDYEALAVRLARDGDALAALKAKLAASRDGMALFDTDRYRRHLEAAFTGMWERYQQGLRPEGFSVPAVET